MRVTVLGCAGSFPSPDSPASGYLLDHDGQQVVLDLGNGASGPLLSLVDPQQLDGIMISHLHADHCADLVPLYVLLKHGPTPLKRRIPVYGPRDLPQRLAGLYSLSDTDLSDVYDFRSLRDQQPINIGQMHVIPARVTHPGESYALRIEVAEVAFVYSGDTAECEALVALSQSADLALFEASCVESQTAPDAHVLELHMSAAGAARTAQRAGVTQLILTHIVQWQPAHAQSLRTNLVTEASRHFSGTVDIAVPGRSWHI